MSNLTYANSPECTSFKRCKFLTTNKEKGMIKLDFLLQL